MAKEIEEVSFIDSDFSDEIKQSNHQIERNVYVYSNCIFPWNGVFIKSVIRVDTTVDCKEATTHYYISNNITSAESFLKKILQEWSVETTHFYKGTALDEDDCKINKGAFSLSVLRSIVINIFHLNKIQNIGRKIVDTTQNLAEALVLFSMVRLEYGFVKS